MLENLWHGYWTVWKKTFVYQGTASRKEFWSFVLINMLLLSIIIAGVFYWLSSQRDGFEAMLMISVAFPPVFTVIFLIFLTPTISVGIRRMHDIGYSGWWFGGVVLLNTLIIPVILQWCIIFFYMMADDYNIRGIVANVCSIVSIISIVVVSVLCCKSGNKNHQLTSGVVE